MTAAITPGIYTAAQLPMAAYLADPCPVPSLSSGAAHKLLTRSPKHVFADHPRLGGRPADTGKAADIGTVAHDLLLGGEGKICVIDAEDWRTKAAKEARDEARASGLTPILPHQHDEAKLMAAAARAFLADSELPGVLDSGEGESTIIARIDDLVWLRARPDWMNYEMRVMLHYKTTEASARPEPFIRGIMESMGYDTGLAFYRTALEAQAGETMDWRHVILVQEQSAPYACSLLALDPAKFAIADDKVNRAIDLWRRCRKSGKWPAYSGLIHYATPSAWQLAKAEEDATRDEIERGSE